MSGLDSLIALIDNGGARSGADRRKRGVGKYAPERRTLYERRSGADRRRVPNNKRQKGRERRGIFIK